MKKKCQNKWNLTDFSSIVSKKHSKLKVKLTKFRVQFKVFMERHEIWISNCQNLTKVLSMKIKFQSGSIWLETFMTTTKNT